MWIAIVYDTTECLDAIRALDALGADAGKEVEHTMVVSQVVQVGVHLSDEAEWRAASAADKLIVWNAWGNPGRLTTELGWRKLWPSDELILRLLNEA